MRIVLNVMLLLALLLLPPLASAQDNTENVASPVSGRYQLVLPEGWVSSNAPIRGLEGVFLYEQIAVGDSAEALASLSEIDPNAPRLGKTLVANIFPTGLAFQGAPATDPQEIFKNILGPAAATATYLEIDGLSGVQMRDYFGPPYATAQFAGQTMVVDGVFIYFLVYGGQSEADLIELETLAAQLDIHPIDAPVYDAANLSQTFTTTDGGLQMTTGTGWMVAQTGAGRSEAYLILPQPDTLLPYVFGGDISPELPDLFIQVLTQPYDLIFGTAETTPTEADYGNALDQAIGSMGGTPGESATEFTLGEAEYPALRIDMQNALGGANTATIVLIDANQVLYTVSFAGASTEWESTYLPIVEAMLDGLQFNVATVDDMAVGLQVGQIAPDFTLNLVDGTPLKLSEYRGQVVLLNFWATWCPPCEFEMPGFQQLYTEQGEAGVVVLAVNMMETSELITPYQERLGLTFPIVLDSDGAITRQYRVVGYPTTYLIDAEGIIRAVNVGPLIAEQLAEWVSLAQ